jgi:antitoxin MazE
MRTTIQRWGNSLALRIPKTLAEDTKLAAGSAVELSLSRGALILRPVGGAYSLDTLLAEVTPENLHGAIDTGPPLGREAW